MKVPVFVPGTLAKSLLIWVISSGFSPLGILLGSFADSVDILVHAIEKFLHELMGVFLLPVDKEHAYFG